MQVRCEQGTPEDYRHSCFGSDRPAGGTRRTGAGTPPRLESAGAVADGVGRQHTPEELRVDWKSTLADNIVAYSSLGIALASLAVSYWVIRQNRQLSQQANYTRIHELLVDHKAASGRRRLFVAETEDAFPSIGESGWDEINYSLALYDTLGAYVKNGLVDREMTLAAWHEPLLRIARPAQLFVDLRSNGQSRPVWSFLSYLVNEAAEFSENRRRGSSLTPARWIWPKPTRHRPHLPARRQRPRSGHLG